MSIFLVLTGEQEEENMKRNSQYFLTEINDIPYLLPFGQNLADFKKSMKINETGVFLWNLLEEEISFDEILRKAGEFYQASEDDLLDLKNDLSNFLRVLNSYGMLEETETFPDCWEDTLSLNIGGLHLLFQGSKGDFSPEFLPFQEEVQVVTDMTLRVLHYLPQHHINGHLLIRDPELNVMDTGDTYVITFPTSPYIHEAHLAKDASYANFYCQIAHTPTSQEQLFHGIRLVFLYLAQKHNMAVIHSASILYKEKAWLFSGSSGTGKSTHTNLWKEYKKVPLINGDLNLITIENEVAVVHGLPWCGTSKISDTKSYPLGGIVLLRKSLDNHIETLTPDSKTLLISQRFISPAWTVPQLQANLSVAKAISEKVLITKLHCTKEKEAVETIKSEFDSQN